MPPRLPTDTRFTVGRMLGYRPYYTLWEKGRLGRFPRASFIPVSLLVSSPPSLPSSRFTVGQFSASFSHTRFTVGLYLRSLSHTRFTVGFVRKEAVLGV